MKLGKLLVLVAVFAALCLAVVVKKTVLDRVPSDRESPAALLSLYPQLAPSFIENVALYKGNGGSRVVLSKNASGEWKLTSHGGIRAAKGAVEPFLKAVVEMKGEVRAQSGKVLADFKLSDDRAVHIEITAAGGKSAHLLVSPLRPGRIGNFVRDQGSDAVLLAPEDLLSRMGIYAPEAGPQYRSFADLQVLPMDVSKVEWAELVTEKEGKLALVREGEGREAVWRFDSAAAADRSKVMAFLAEVSNLYASDLPDADSASSFAVEAGSWVAIREKGGVAKEIQLGPLDAAKKTYLVRARPEGLVYLISQASIDSLKKDKSFFKAAS